MKKIRKILIFPLILSLCAALLPGCGKQQENTGNTAAVTETATPAPAGDTIDQESLESMLNDILAKREAAENEAEAQKQEAAAEEPAPADPFIETAKDLVVRARALCDSGSSLTAEMARSSYELASYYEFANTESTFVSYISGQKEQLSSIASGREDLKTLLNDLSSADAPATDTGREVKKQLKSLVTEMDESFAQLEELADFYQEQNDLYDEYMDFDSDLASVEDSLVYIENYYAALKGLQTAYRKMKTPSLVSEIWAREVTRMNVTADTMYYSYMNLGYNSPLDNYLFAELSEYDAVLSSKYDTLLLNTMGSCFEQTSAVFEDTYSSILTSIEENCLGGTGTASYARPANPVFDYTAVNVICPNSYPSLDSIVNLTASTTAARQDVIISAKVEGFTQEYRQKVTLTTRPQFFMIKPALLTELPDLSTSRRTQLVLTITDNDTGKVLVQDSRSVTLYSIYDFFYVTDEFGVTSTFDLLGWLRPESEAVAKINRQAISYLESTGIGDSLAGYQYAYSEDEATNTLIQVAAIQKAISDLGIRYSNDAYSFRAHQHILTPDQVVANKSGLCIESTLLMASCLLSAGFHVMIVLIPGHAQVAVESWNGANGRTGEYFLIETTDLPYSGFTIRNGTISLGDLVQNLEDSSNEWWKEYLGQEDGDIFNDGDVFIIDCDLRSELGMQGLESVHADLNFEPVSYPSAPSGSGPASSPAETGTPSGTEEQPVLSDTSEDVLENYCSVVTSADGTYSFYVLKELEASVATENNLVLVPIMPGSELPQLLVFAQTGIPALDYASAWLEMLRSESTVPNPPSEYKEMDYNGHKLYGIEYNVSDGTTETLYLYETGELSFAGFYLIYPSDLTEDELDYLFTCLQLALGTFQMK